MSDNKPIIVAIDDHPVILHILINELGGQYHIVPFTAGEKALSYLETRSADIILLDYDMPGMNGSEVLRSLRSNKRLSGIPTIFLTGTSDGNTEVEMLEMGASDYIQKPFTARILQTRVKLQLELARYRNHIESLVEERTEQLQQANEKLKLREEVTLNLLAEATDMRDHDTGGHIQRTTEMVRVLVEELLSTQMPGYELTDIEADDIIRSAKLHDLGKIAVPDSVLLKPGKLDEEEFEIIRQHPLYGGRLLEKYISSMGEDSFLTTAKNIALYHHEKWNGTGYPHGLSGDAIPLCARITALADVYDALTSTRPYKKPFLHDTAVKIIADESGKHFDPYIVEVFLKHEKNFTLPCTNT